MFHDWPSLLGALGECGFGGPHVTGAEWVKWPNVNVGCLVLGALLAVCAGSAPSTNKIDSIKPLCVCVCGSITHRLRTTRKHVATCSDK